MRRDSRNRIARRLGAGVLALAVGVVSVPAAGAEEDERGWLDAIVDFLTRPEGAPVDVPLRKQVQPGEPAPAAAPDAAPPEPPPPEAPPPEALQTGDAAPPAPAPAAVPPERLEGATLAHVHRAVENLVAEIETLRAASGAGDAPPEAPPLLEDRAPVHVYVKTLEVWGKVAQAQRRSGLPAGPVGRIPNEAVDAPDLLVAVEHTRAALATVTAHAGVEPGLAAAAEPAAAPSPSALYRRLAHASALLDVPAGGPLTSDDVHRHAQAALDEVARIAERLDAALDPETPPVQGPKHPLDVAQQLLRALYKAVHLQARLHMDASRVPTMNLEGASPTGNHDMLNLLRAELARIGWHLGIAEATPEPRPAPPAGAGAAGAFAAVQRIVRTLDRLAGAAPE